MAIQIFNSLTREKENFVPIEEGKVRMYVCGPTVYNYIHIGNARPVIVYDTVRRYLTYRGFEVDYVSNFTDVDDKIIKAANELGEEVPELTERFINAYFEDITALGCQKADSHPRVTEHMDAIINFIAVLIEKGFAYESQGDVYYRTRKFKGYGKLSHQSVDDLKIGARIEAGEKKEDALDFALWKAAKPGEIFWQSPWGEGRPGWHIECSVMVHEHFGDKKFEFDYLFDILSLKSLTQPFKIIEKTIDGEVLSMKQYIKDNNSVYSNYMNIPLGVSLVP